VSNWLTSVPERDEWGRYIDRPIPIPEKTQRMIHAYRLGHPRPRKDIVAPGDRSATRVAISVSIDTQEHRLYVIARCEACGSEARVRADNFKHRRCRCQKGAR
jgi:hypothetical protein